VFGDESAEGTHGWSPLLRKRMKETKKKDDKERLRN
jgi:hypothetical protein